MNAYQPMKVESVTKRIAECAVCPNSAPFFFEIGSQKTMIITAAGNLQTTFFPLLTVRFVRNLLYSLFGKSGLTEEGFQRLFERHGIYWTSFHKCYDRYLFRKIDGKYAMDKFTSTKCAEIFLQREIDAVQPKLLIVMGKATCQAIRDMVGKEKILLPLNTIFTDYFYKEQDPQVIEKVRKSLAKVLNISIELEPFDVEMTKTAKTDAQVHYQYQLCAAQALRVAQGESIGSSLSPPYENEVEQLWIEQVTKPILRRYYMFLNYWSSIESSLLSFLSNENDKTKAETTNQQGLPIALGNNVMLLRKMNVLSESLLFHVNQYLESRNSPSLMLEWNVLKDRLEVIKTIRNSIVHASGFMPFSTVYMKVSKYENNYNINYKLSLNNFDGIKVIPNMVYIESQGLDEMDALYRQLTDFLVRAEKDCV